MFERLSGQSERERRREIEAIADRAVSLSAELGVSLDPMPDDPGDPRNEEAVIEIVGDFYERATDLGYSLDELDEVLR